MLEHLLVSEKKQVLMERTLGEYLESINSKKYNSLSLPNLKNPGPYTSK
jgi:hypothetical protein